MKFKLLNGFFDDKFSGKRIEKGGIVESQKDLCELFPNKFSLLNTTADPVKSTVPEVKSIPKQEPIIEQAPIPTPQKKTTLLGTDVTDRFPVASKSSLRIFRKGNTYNVTDNEELGVALNDQPLNKIGLSEFLKSYASK